MENPEAASQNPDSTKQMFRFLGIIKPIIKARSAVEFNHRSRILMSIIRDHLGIDPSRSLTEEDLQMIESYKEEITSLYNSYLE